jgi:hypothetical protein
MQQCRMLWSTEHSPILHLPLHWLSPWDSVDVPELLYSCVDAVGGMIMRAAAASNDTADRLRLLASDMYLPQVGLLVGSLHGARK